MGGDSPPAVSFGLEGMGAFLVLCQYRGNFWLLIDRTPDSLQCSAVIPLLHPLINVCTAIPFLSCLIV